MAKKTFAGSHVELRYNTYFAVLYVPKDVRHIIGKIKFYKSTETGNLKLAETRASAWVLGWKAQIANARASADDEIIRSALGLASEYKQQKNHLVKEIIKEVIDEETDKIKREQGNYKSEIFKGLASGKYKLLKELIPQWKLYQEKRGLKQKTIDQMNSDIEVLAVAYPTAEFLTEEKINLWINTFLEANGLRTSSINRVIGSCRNFFNYLVLIGEVEKELKNPFIVPDKFRISKKPNAKSVNKVVPWVPFKTSEVEHIYKSAKNDKKPNQNLITLIMLGAYTGARIEEICSLGINNINLQEETITFIDSKTSAGNRTIPIHSNIKYKVRNLIESSTDGYLISGLTFNKYGDRSNAIGKAFGRLKSKLGYSDSHVFHSIRKTVVTQLENAGVSENLAADIVGHEKPRITYGLYSGGATIQVMREAIEKIYFDFS